MAIHIAHDIMKFNIPKACEKIADLAVEMITYRRRARIAEAACLAFMLHVEEIEQSEINSDLEDGKYAAVVVPAAVYRSVFAVGLRAEHPARNTKAAA